MMDGFSISLILVERTDKIGEKHHDEKHHHEKHKEEIHAEFHALYHFSCKNPASYTDLQYFEAFPHAKALLARTITAKGQRKQRLTRKAPRLIF